MTFSITQGRRKTPVGQGKTFRIFSPSLLSRQSKVDRRVGEKGHDSWDFLGQTDGARHNRKFKWQFNLTEPTKTKSNANKAPFPLHLTWKCSWVSLSCVHIHTRIWLSYLAYVLVRTYRIDALILARADEGDIFVAPLVHHIGANCNRRKGYSKLKVHEMNPYLGTEILAFRSPWKKKHRNHRVNSYSSANRYVTAIASISINI